MKEEFAFKTTEPGFNLKLIYDRGGGITIIKHNKENGVDKYQEVHLCREAMFSLALKLLRDAS